MEAVEAREASGSDRAKGEGALWPAVTGAILGDETVRTGCVDGGRRVGSMGEARYIKGAEAEAISAVEVFKGGRETE